jgi:hypothetical protein
MKKNQQADAAPSAQPLTRQRPSKVQLTCRVSPLIKRLIKYEWDHHFDSEGQAVEALILRGAISPEAHAMILAEAENDPMMLAVKQAMAANPPTRS